MARMRTIKPEFWDDDVIAGLSRDARLLFIASWNAADDEGLLRWNASFLKAKAFMYDDDLGAEEVERLMAELVDADLVLPYQGGKSLQRLAVIIKFHRHQKVNRPQPSKLPPPSLQNPTVAQMYARRDGWVCYLCSDAIEWATTNNAKRLSLDHVQPQSKGGSDYPSNIKIAHCGCNSGKRDTFTSESVSESRSDSVNGSSEAVDSVTDGVGKGVGRGEVKVVVGATAPRTTLAPLGAPTAQTLVGEWIDHCEKRPPQRVIGPVAQSIAALLAEGIDPDDVRRGLAKWTERGLHPSTLPSVVNEVMNAGGRSRGQDETDAMFERAARRLGVVQ